MIFLSHFIEFSEDKSILSKEYSKNCIVGRPNYYDYK